MSEPCVEQIVDGRNSWKIGFLGFLVRSRGQVASGLLAFVFMGTPWWLPEDIPWNQQFNVDIRLVIAAVILLLVVIWVLGLRYLKQRSIRSLNTKYFLHKLAHDIRDSQTDLHKSLLQKETHQKHLLDQMLQKNVENIAQLFRRLVNDDSVCASIRLASFSDSKKIIVYQTVARSSGYNESRGRTSEDIPANKGIPRYLSEQANGCGILLYNDLIEAAKMGAFHLTHNEKNFPNDVKTMIVAPLNAWFESDKNLIGTLHITSRNKSVFKPIHYDSVGFVADLTAEAIANTFEIIEIYKKP